MQKRLLSLPIFRRLRLRLRELHILWLVSRSALVTFGAIVLGGALLFHFFYTFPETTDHPGFSLSLYAAFALIFFESVLPFPEGSSLQLFFYLIPVLGLLAVVDGVLQFGSTLISRQARGQKWQVAMASTYKDHIIVCGAGKVGYRVILELLKFEREIVAIEVDEDGQFIHTIQGMGIPLLFEDAARKETLIKAGIMQASAIVPCTNDELRNLDIALKARELQPGIKVVLRMFEADLAARVEKGFGIHTAFSTSALAAPVFASAAMKLDVKHSFYVGETLMVISELEMASGSSLIGMSVNELEEGYDLSVVCSIASGQAELHPDGEHVITAGEKLLLMSSVDIIRQVQALNQAG